MKHFGLKALAALVLAMPLTAAAQTLPASVAESKVIRVVMAASYPPLESRDPKTNELIGFDVDLSNAIAKILNVKIEYQDGAFEQMMPSVQSGRADMIVSGFYDIPKRQDRFDFIDYMRAGAQFYTLKTADIKQPTDLCGQTITTTRGSNYPDSVKAWSDKNCVAAGKQPISIIVDSDLGQQLGNLKQGRAVAAVTGLEAVPTIVQMEGNNYRPFGEPFSSRLMGIAFAKDNAQLRDAVKAALQKVIADGTYAELIKKWKLDLSVYTDATINAGEAS